MLPSRRLAIPFFSDYAQTVAATGRTANIVAMTGRELFKLTRGATLLLNPNGVSCALYPEEAAALLDRNEVAIIEQMQTTDSSLKVVALEQPPHWLLDPLALLYSRLPSIESAYLIQLESKSEPDEYGLLIALAVATEDAEGCARATATWLQSLCTTQGSPTVDLTTFAPEHPPGWLAELQVEPFYRRDWGERVLASGGAIN